MKLLVVEDDRELLRNLLRFFDSLAYMVDHAKTLKEANEAIQDNTYDCIVLDINLPDGSGLNLLDNVKKQKNKCGVIILSANDELDDKLIGLDLGADDYLTKPFHLSELNARIRSIVRRKQHDGENTIELNEIVIDLDAQEVTIHGTPLKLTKKEYDLLLFMITNKNKVVTKASISQHLWGDYIDHSDSFDFIYTHLKNLRKKIVAAGGEDYIQSVYGLGYRLKT